MVNKDKIFHEHFLIPIQSSGKITLLIAAAGMFLPGLFLFIFHDLTPPIGPTMKALAALWSFMIIIGTVEILIYYPILGFGGTYMTFLVGNAINLRVPVSAASQQIAETGQGTPEAEIVSTLGIAGSVLASQVVMIIGTLAFFPFISKIQGSGMAVEVALNQVLPALFGALLAGFLFRVPRIAFLPLILAFIIAFLNNNLPYSVVVPPMVIVSILSARIFYKKGWIKGESMMQ